MLESQIQSTFQLDYTQRSKEQSLNLALITLIWCTDLPQHSCLKFWLSMMMLPF
ncbi:hypothetical protein PLAN_130007 [Planktothrix rubescens CCAP 1459/22]|uniref:Uncharacterized protein n=1 Tax=Planktothrix rubescens CCAP 1459/22 TaxID=329571 RepID=A0A6J7ZI18_PLARU|nr:hypothetical protein PLAN_130007 [Planktothrix rubescens NIVA-CYA 18]CAD0229346.1 conserved hypothetical protein [Planktothrix agardhii]